VAAELRSRLVEDRDRAGSEVVITSDHLQFSCLDGLRNDRRGSPQKHRLTFRIGFGRRLQVVARLVYGRLNVWIQRAELPGRNEPRDLWPVEPPECSENKYENAKSNRVATYPYISAPRTQKGTHATGRLAGRELILEPGLYPADVTAVVWP
jgi:hypothetical protein